MEGGEDWLFVGKKQVLLQLASDKRTENTDKLRQHRIRKIKVTTVELTIVAEISGDYCVPLVCVSLILICD